MSGLSIYSPHKPASMFTGGLSDTVRRQPRPPLSMGDYPAQSFQPSPMFPSSMADYPTAASLAVRKVHYVLGWTEADVREVEESQKAARERQEDRWGW